VLAWLSVAVPAASADEVPAPPPPSQGPPTDTTNPAPTPEPPPQSAPSGDTAPAPSPGDGTTPPQDSPPQSAPEGPAPSGSGAGDSWTSSPDRSSDSGPQGTSASPSGAGTDTPSGTVLAKPDSHPSNSGNIRDSLAVAPGVDDFDSFTGADSGGMGLLLDDSTACGTVVCGTAAGGLVASVGASAEQIQQSAARERDVSRVEGLARAMPPSPPGGIPGRAFSMPGGTGGGGGASMLISMGALLCAALALGNWARSFRLPTATWRLSAYIPPIESPG
jgi:hypothetical protein